MPGPLCLSYVRDVHKGSLFLSEAGIMWTTENAKKMTAACLTAFLFILLTFFPSLADDKSARVPAGQTTVDRREKVKNGGTPHQPAGTIRGEKAGAPTSPAGGKENNEEDDDDWGEDTIYDNDQSC